MEQIFGYIDLTKNKDVRLAFDALKVRNFFCSGYFYNVHKPVRVEHIKKLFSIRRLFQYLASLLVHRKFALEFVAHSGVEYLVNVYQSSMASVAVSTCLYYLAYNEDVMEK